MPIPLLKELQIPVLITNQSFFISGQAVCRKERALCSRAHSLRKGGTVEHPSPASSPACALNCRSSKSLEIKRVLGFWRQFSNQNKAYFNIMLLFKLALPTAQSSALKTASYFCWHPAKSVYLLQFLPLWQEKKGKNSRKASCCLRGHVFNHLPVPWAGRRSFPVLCFISWIFRITANRPHSSVGLGGWCVLALARSCSYNNFCCDAAFPGAGTGARSKCWEVNPFLSGWNLFPGQRKSCWRSSTPKTAF